VGSEMCIRDRIIGPRELAENTVRLKDMRTGDEEIIEITGIVDAVTRSLA